MNFTNLFRIAVKALSNNKLRGFLTMLGIIIGVASVITMLAIGQGSKRSIQAEISEMGSNMIMIHPGGDRRGGVQLSADDMQSLKIKDFFDMELPIRRLEQSQAETAIFLGKVGVGISVENLNAGRFDQYDGIFLLLDDVDQFDGATIQLPETTCVDIRFRGSHPEAPEQYRKLLAYLAEHQLEAADFAREVTMIDYGITKDTGKFVTEISIPVRPKA